MHSLIQSNDGFEAEVDSTEDRLALKDGVHHLPNGRIDVVDAGGVSS